MKERAVSCELRRLQSVEFVPTLTHQSRSVSRVRAALRPRRAVPLSADLSTVRAPTAVCVSHCAPHSRVCVRQIR